MPPDQNYGNTWDFLDPILANVKGGHLTVPEAKQQIVRELQVGAGGGGAGTFGKAGGQAGGMTGR